MLIYINMPTFNPVEIMDAEVSERRTYMREWKQNKYAEDAESIKAYNRAHYFRKTHNLPKADLKKYGTLLPLVFKTRAALAELKIADPNILDAIIKESVAQTLAQ